MTTENAKTDAETPAGTPPADDNQPKPGHRRINVPAHHFDVKIDPDPLPSRLWSFATAEAKNADNYAAEAFAAGWRLAIDSVKLRKGSTDPDTGVDTPPDREAARASDDQALAYMTALENLRAAAEHLRIVRLALSPYVEAEKLTRGY